MVLKMVLVLLFIDPQLISLPACGRRAPFTIGRKPGWHESMGVFIYVLSTVTPERWSGHYIRDPGLWRGWIASSECRNPSKRHRAMVPVDLRAGSITS